MAISLVIVSHGLAQSFPIVTKLGALGVNLFFALSGYLICTLLLSEQEENGTISLSAFYKRRVFRIVPPALIYLAVVALLGAAGIITLRKGELLSAFYAANYFHARSWFTEHFWSLSMEEHFYLFWPAILVLLGPRKARFAALGLVGTLLLYRPWGERHFDASAYQHTDMRLDAFLLPCTLAIVLKEPAWRARFASLLRPWVCVLLAGTTGAFSALAAMNPAYDNVQKLFQSAVCPLLIVSTVLRPSFLGIVLELPAIRWVGRISYSLYLWQQLFLFQEHPGPPFVLRVLFIVAFATASYYFVERPMIRFGQRMASPPTAAPLLESVAVRASQS